MRIKFDNNRPIYIQIMEYIYGNICRGELKPGEKLPSVREMAVDAGVNPNTVSRTYMEMEREKIVESKRGQGTFVTEDDSIIARLKKATTEKQIEAFVDTLNQYGYTQGEIVTLIQEYVNNGGGNKSE
ncbi:GntR family transcriptional regulator [Alteribacter populi]|uniref:GntR family transcriptional regulator n=1 Tax=Alteribacter populi TaxID=2011011 RepID=UPI000BBA7CB2|nr:GntR family transcriptional regulator [Alteribacter populi]